MIDLDGNKSGMMDIAAAENTGSDNLRPGLLLNGINKKPLRTRGLNPGTASPTYQLNADFCTIMPDIISSVLAVFYAV